MFKISELVFTYAIQTFHQTLDAYGLFKNLKQDKIMRILIDKPSMILQTFHHSKKKKDYKLNNEKNNEIYETLPHFWNCSSPSFLYVVVTDNSERICLFFFPSSQPWFNNFYNKIVSIVAYDVSERSCWFLQKMVNEILAYELFKTHLKIFQFQIFFFFSKCSLIRA